MTSSFQKIYGSAVTHGNTRVGVFRFVHYGTRLKKSSFRLPKHGIHVDERTIRYKVLIYTAKRVSVWMASLSEMMHVHEMKTKVSDL